LLKWLWRRKLPECSSNLFENPKKCRTGYSFVLHITSVLSGKH
jgi:hypothetical protein